MTNQQQPRAFGHIRGVSVDFYGTIVAEDDAVLDGIRAAIAAHASQEKAACFWRHWGTAFAHACRAYQDGCFRTQGDLAQATLGEALDLAGIGGLDHRALARRQQDFWSRPDPHADALLCLDRLRLPFVILSNIDESFIRDALEHIGRAAWADRLVTSERCRCYKPHPRMFQTAAQCLGLPSPDILHIGDSWSADVIGARAHGMGVLWLNRRGRAAADPTVASIGSFADLPGHLAAEACAP